MHAKGRILYRVGEYCIGIFIVMGKGILRKILQVQYGGQSRRSRREYWFRIVGLYRILDENIWNIGD